MWIRKPEALGATDSYLGTKEKVSFKNNNSKADTEKTKLENEVGGGGQKMGFNIFFRANGLSLL